MTRRLSLAKADRRLSKLQFLRHVGQPNEQVRELLVLCAFYRGEIDRLQRGDTGGFVERVTK